MNTLYRTQILLEPGQHKKLKEIAKIEGCSVSELMREMVRNYLEEQERDMAKQRELQALAKLVQMQNLLKERHGVYQRDLIAELRDERDDESEQVWWSKS
ncbi:MAG: CopG family transcriptional regulator [Candidatus Promineifilaceae bacterium]|jgi:metal-responsive CopG/Arc/MetJ family transcriptional regulator